MKLFQKILGIVTAGVFSVTAATCGDIKDENWARDFFNRNENTLVKIQELVSSCEGKGTLSIYPDGQLSSPGTVNCPHKNEIVEILKTIDVLWINVSGDLPYGKQGPFGTMFVLSSFGLLVSGSGSSIYYFPDLKTNPFGDSIPLKGSPGHWFYRRS